MVKLIHHNVVKVVAGKLLKMAMAAKGLDGSKEQVGIRRPFLAIIKANMGFGQDTGEGFLCLQQYLFPMCHKQNPFGLELSGIKGGQPGLAQSCGQYHQSTLIAGQSTVMKGLQGFDLNIAALLPCLLKS